MQNIKDKHAEQPAKKREASYRIQVLPLLNSRGWQQPVTKIFA
jgi:hypothetical protein